ncbi:MAG: hypothetical protein ACK5MU_02120 [Candidatus Saccharimonadales bacterium]
MMVNMWFLILLMANFGISWWNAYSVGSVWSESKEIGGSMRVLAICGYIMAIAGFTMVYGFVLMLIVIWLHPVVPFLESIPLDTLIGLTSDMLYVLLAMTIIPSGLVIWLNSVVYFWKNKTLGNGMVAGWNTYANVRNVINASREMPSAIGRIGDAIFDSDDDDIKGKLVVVALIIVVLAALGGYFTASVIMKNADRKVDLFARR